LLWTRDSKKHRWGVFKKKKGGGTVPTPTSGQSVGYDSTKGLKTTGDSRGPTGKKTSFKKTFGNSAKKKKKKNFATPRKRKSSSVFGEKKERGGNVRTIGNRGKTEKKSNKKPGNLRGPIQKTRVGGGNRG